MESSHGEIARSLNERHYNTSHRPGEQSRRALSDYTNKLMTPPREKRPRKRNKAKIKKPVFATP
jgi:hypothetical protein